MDYTYCDRNLLEEKETYQYSKYYGNDFISAYFDNRKRFLNALKGNGLNFFDAEKNSNTFDFMKSFYNGNETTDRFALLLKRFEVTKKLFLNTDENFRKVNDSPFDDLDLYVLFELCCFKAFKETHHLSFLNAMLKCGDILISQKDFSKTDVSHLKIAIEQEVSCVKEIENEI